MQPHVDGTSATYSAPSATDLSDFLATQEGLALTRAFTRIKEARLRRRIVDLIEEIAEDRV